MAFSTNSSWLDLCNNALVRLNRQQMQTFQEGSTAANACNQALPMAVSHILSQSDWKSARKRAIIAPQAETPAFGFAYKHRIPNDFVRLVELPECDSWAREGAYFLSDSTPLKMIYIAYPDNPGELDPLLQEAIACSLTAQLAMALISDATVVNAWQSKAELAIARAKLTEQAGEKDTLLVTHDLAGEM